MTKMSCMCVALLIARLLLELRNNDYVSSEFQNTKLFELKRNDIGESDYKILLTLVI